MAYTRARLGLLIDTLKYRHFMSEVEMFLSLQTKLDMTGAHSYDYHADYKQGISPIAAAKRAILAAAIYRADAAPRMEIA